MTNPKDKLFYGDNLDVLRRHIADESVDLIYLDPPFNSAQSYNVLFADRGGTQSAAQIQAFEDTWRWDESSSAAYHELVEAGGKVSEVMQAFRLFLGDNDMLAYLAMMAPRLVELRRVLRPTGSLYLHCDPTASHYLKTLLDAVFGPLNFRNEIIWKRTNARSTAGRWPRVHDVLLFYSAGDTFKFNPAKVCASTTKMPHTLITGRNGKKYQTYELTAPGQTQEGESGRPWRGQDPDGFGRHWANNIRMMEEWEAAGLIHWPKNGGFPRRRDAKPFEANTRTVTVDDVWTDIDRLNQTAKERLGYPTQKPEALLDRIVMASSNEGDRILDPFCGCGTSIAAAQRLDRRWIGIDITHLAIGLIKSRLSDLYGDTLSYDVIGEPTTVDGAAELARQEPYQFQAWALGLVGARQSGAIKKGADKGIDGRLYFRDANSSSKTRSIILSVKAGHVTVSQVRDLVGVLQREKAEIGVLLSFEEPTKPMRAEAASAGVYVSPWGRHPRVQLLTVGELLKGARIDYPRTVGSNETFKKAPKARRPAAVTGDLFVAAD